MIVRTLEFCGRFILSYPEGARLARKFQNLKSNSFLAFPNPFMRSTGAVLRADFEEMLLRRHRPTSPRAPIQFRACCFWPQPEPAFPASPLRSIRPRAPWFENQFLSGSTCLD